MISLKKISIRWTLCVFVFLLVWIVGVAAMGRVLFSSETLFDHWKSGVRIFSDLGLLSYMDGEGTENAVVESLMIFWIPIAAWTAWQLNRWLKRSQE
jgi:hypothetical protein